LLLSLPAQAGGDSAPAASPTAVTLDTAAQRLFIDGEAAYEREDYDKAYTLLLGAWKLQPHWQVAARLGACALKLGKPVEAATVLAVYAREAPADHKDKAAALLAEATANVGTVVVTIDAPDAEILVNGVPTSAKPGEPIYVEADASHKVAARKGDVIGEVDLVARAGRTHNVSLTLGSSAAETGPRKEVVIAGAAVGGAALVVGIATGIAALGASGKAQSQLDAIRVSGTPCKPSPASGPCADLLAARNEQSALTNTALWSFVGAGAVGIGTVIYALATRSQPPSAGFTITPAVGFNGGGVAITGRF
jgi:hypothetical protein